MCRLRPIDAYSSLCVPRAATSNYFLYFVPSQCVASIKIRLLGVASLLE